MINEKIENLYGLRCPKTDGWVDNLFFSLVDYKNNYFTSKCINDLEAFYNSFSDVRELIEWMKERPKGIPYITEVCGRTDIVIVIPTSDLKGEFALNCRDSIYPGMQIIFIESGAKEDFYFNFAHYVNVGMKRALDYDPKWIVFSSDDMFKIDDVNVLIGNLQGLDNKALDVVFTKPSKYHSIPVYYSKSKLTRIIAFKLIKKRRVQLKIENKFGRQYFSNPKRVFWRLFFKIGYEHLSISDFGIFSTEFVKKKNGSIFDETYVNSSEDVDLSMELTIDHNKITIIDYRIGDLIGKTLGKSPYRHIKDIAGEAYLEAKVRHRVHPASYLISKQTTEKDF